MPVALLEYALGMAERAEACDPMVFAHTACTDPAERHIVCKSSPYPVNSDLSK
jgi:hypothetical protein